MQPAKQIPWNKGVARSSASIAKYVATRKANGKRTQQPLRGHKPTCSRGHTSPRYESGWCKACAFEDSRTLRSKIYNIWWSARQRARERLLPFSITQQDILAVWPDDNICPITLLVLQISGKNDPRCRGPEPASPSIDKIIPELGYVKDNIAVISNLANRIKSDITDPEVFDRLAAWLRRRRAGTHLV